MYDTHIYVLYIHIYVLYIHIYVCYTFAYIQLYSHTHTRTHSPSPSPTPCPSPSSSPIFSPPLLLMQVNSDSDFNLAKHVCHVHQVQILTSQLATKFTIWNDCRSDFWEILTSELAAILNRWDYWLLRKMTECWFRGPSTSYQKIYQQKHHRKARLACSLKLQVSFAKEPCKWDYILRKRPVTFRSLLIVATPYQNDMTVKLTLDQFDRSTTTRHRSTWTKFLTPTSSAPILRRRTDISPTYPLLSLSTSRVPTSGNYFGTCEESRQMSMSHGTYEWVMWHVPTSPTEHFAGACVG